MNLFHEHVAPQAFEIGERVDYYQYHNSKWANNYGKVIGSATVIKNGLVTNLVMVELTKEFYDADQDVCTSMVAIYRDRIRSRSDHDMTTHPST